eukprot:g1944.t1
MNDAISLAKTTSFQIQHRSMSRVKTVKYFSNKVAIVYGLTTPVANCICLKLIEQGARLILMDLDRTESAANLSREMNLLWGGLDANYYSENDPWGAKTVAKHLYVSREGKCDEDVRNFSLTWFGKVPELLIDVSSGDSSPIDINSFMTNFSRNQIVCIQPLNYASLWSTGWLAATTTAATITHNEDLESIDAYHENIAVYTTTQLDLICNLVNKKDNEIQGGDSSEIWRMKTDDLIMVLAYLLHDGQYITTDDFESHLNTDGESCSLDSCLSAPHCTKLEIEKIKLNTLLDISMKKEAALLQIQETGLLKGVVSDELASELDLWTTGGHHELTEDDGYTTTDSDLVNNGTFDALLQKTKDYPVDWWQGGCERFVSIDDINCKGLAKAAVNFAVRWLVLGYFVIGFAFPKVLGWTSS